MHIKLLQGLSDTLLLDLEQCHVEQVGRVLNIDAPNRETAWNITKLRWEWHIHSLEKIVFTINGEYFNTVKGEHPPMLYQEGKDWIEKCFLAPFRIENQMNKNRGDRHA